MSPRIAIVGGGPAGLTLGVLLHKQNIPFTIFERRSQPTAAEIARPSGMLDLHEGSGLDAIAACGLTDEFLPLAGECSQQFWIANRDGDVLAAANGQGKRPEISRNNLGALLRGHVPAESIRWGHRLASASRGDGGIVLDFGHTRATFDLVVGADGAWSKVRSSALLLPDTKPRFTGMHCITLTVTHLTTRFPHLAAMVGSGSFLALGRRHAVISQRGPLDSARLYLWLTVADEHFATTAGLAGKPAAAAKDVLLQRDDLLQTFGPRVQDLVRTACDHDVATDRDDGLLDVRAFYTLPHGCMWPSQTGVTLMGDAAHLMLPNGEGVNQAMLDALHLSRAIGKAYATMVAATATEGAAASEARTQAGTQVFLEVLDLETYEKEMTARAVEEGEETDERIGRMFGSDDAAYEFTAVMNAMKSKAMAKGQEAQPEEKPQ